MSSQCCDYCNEIMPSDQYGDHLSFEREIYQLREKFREKRFSEGQKACFSRMFVDMIDSFSQFFEMETPKEKKGYILYK